MTKLATRITPPTRPDAITLHKGGGMTIEGPKAMELYKLLTLKSGLCLEINCRGMVMSRHGSALKFAKQVTGLRSNNRHAHLVVVERMIAELNQEVPRVRSSS